MTKRLFLSILVLFSLSAYSFSKEASRKIIQGFDGGMFLHSGYVSGTISPIGYKAKGAPSGIGGVIRFHMGENWRVGTEGYMSNLSQLGNGSYVKVSWGGLLVDYRLHFGSFEPYAGITLGGGANKNLLMHEVASSPWMPINNTIYQKLSFVAITPFIGCEYALTASMHLAVKIDYLNAVDCPTVPVGPRAYIGFIFSH